jgi:hypothetical protein
VEAAEIRVARKRSAPTIDFSASPAIATLANGRNLLVIPQKAGLGYALDPDKDGAIVWQYRLWRGSGIGWRVGNCRRQPERLLRDRRLQNTRHPAACTRTT